MRNYLLVDFGSTFTKLTAVDLDKEDIIATSKAITTVDTNIIDGYDKALKRLYQKIGEKIEFEKVIACSSAAGGLKMVAIGLVEELTTEAATRVCLGAGAKVELVLSHNINNAEVQSILDKKIDIVLLAGGANGGNKECVIHNAKQLAKSEVKAPIVFAGNKDASDEIIEILSAAKKDFYICENVMPRLNVLNINSARDQIKEVFVKNIIEAKGIKKVEKIIDRVILPTPNAVLMAAELLSKGFDDEEGLGDLMIADLGGATTDIYSMADGLPTQMNALLSGLEEPFAKRTVEGDLGMRYSALGVLQSMSAAEISHWNKEGIDIVMEATKRFEDIEFISESDHDYIVDDIIAAKCVDTATSRHIGTLKGVYTPMGIMYYQVGKDLTGVKYFIGTGGVIISSRDPIKILQRASKTESKPMELRPGNPDYLLDKDYILSAMGLLSVDFPEIALKIMKKHIVKI
ncbi:methylaspartate mutase accessory protein GlmL [Peloplasma aerotolerans]|uniref:Methylaspartate mutase accessory protein GlmL n=1 Tax=Peloplasma aerotolerans TaxID=3044389 RepID=A0AAW6U5X4_9MOLU|nr:methylaspartate mutase accessory protein GlmL [Mariniplasma sp. M4Ah]MDI6453381.1 methylaspartate mutase accessory protein GlmL [Mariniplasma sp. M4Ah]MDR4968748.1 methylaspartate mutase accessory protein GlmL [Acholeplasmataceae bacterium]